METLVVDNSRNFVKEKATDSKKTYGLAFFETFVEASKSRQELKKLCEKFTQVNIVIKEEGDMDKNEILPIDEKIKVYAGEAWTLIHKRREEDGWYK